MIKAEHSINFSKLIISLKTSTHTIRLPFLYLLKTYEVIIFSYDLIIFWIFFSLQFLELKRKNLLAKMDYYLTWRSMISWFFLIVAACSSNSRSFAASSFSSSFWLFIRSLSLSKSCIFCSIDLMMSSTAVSLLSTVSPRSMSCSIWT